MGKCKKLIAISLSLLLMLSTVKVNAASENEQKDNTTSVSSEKKLEETSSDVMESYGYDSIVKEAEAKQEYRDSVEYVDNTVVFSVLQYRKTREKAVYLKDTDAVCKNNNLKKVEFILETKTNMVEKKDGYTAYQMFYSATVKTNDIWSVVDELSLEESILSAEPDFIWEKSDQDDMTEISGETLAAEVECAGWSYTDLDCIGIWNSLTQNTAPGAGVVVAVIDTGVDYNHVDLKKNMWVNSGEISGNGIDDDGNGYIDDIHGINLIDPSRQGDPMDDHGHGTHVAGIIGMTAGNGGGVGIAYGSKIMAIKAGQASGVFASTDIAKAIQYAAANGADVINMSFGGTGKSNLVEAALADAFGSCVLVAAAGNDGLPTTDIPNPVPAEDMYPAGYSYVLGVMACDSYGNLAGFSNWDYYTYENCEYEMIAPGVQIYSTIPGNRYARWSGTSMASPMVAAAAAILRREYSDVNKYSSRYIMGQLSSATRDVVTYLDKYDNGSDSLHVYKKLNISDSLNYQPKPNIGVSDIVFFDGTDISESNNNDGIIQAGETIDLGFVISNHWGIAKDVSITVDAKSSADIDNPYVQFITDSIDLDDEIGTFGTINNGYRYNNNELVGVEKPIRIKISEDAPNDLFITLNYDVTAKNGMDDKDTKIYGYYNENRLHYTFNVQRGTYLRGTISEDTTLTSEKLWIVDRSLTIAEGVTVKVNPGTKIQFYSIEEGPYAENHISNILVKGKMLFEGTYANPIEIYPCKGRESFKVEIKEDSSENAQIDMNYVKIRNPELNASICNHLDLSQDEMYVRSYKNSAGVISLDDTRWVSVIADSITNSKMRDFTHGDTQVFCTPKIYGKINTVLFNNNYSSFGLNEYDSTIRHFDNSIKNSVFLNNYNETYAGLRGSLLNLRDGEAKNNAILNDKYFSSWFKVTSTYFPDPKDADFSYNYWGTTNESLINKMIIDNEDDASYGKVDYSNYLTLESDMSSIYPFVTEAYITDSTGENRLSEVVNSQTVQVHVKFNRDMSQDTKYEPMVSFGPSEPYTDFVVDGDWASAREWVGTIKIDPFINQGTQYLRIKDAAAADDLWLTTGTDAARFSFDITKSSAEALTLQGSGGSNENNLNWVQDDYDTLAGYNLYRATEYDKDIDLASQSFTKINTSIIAPDEKEYTDKDVEQGQDYYYYFTVLDTQFAESPASNVVKCTPFDEEYPVISTKAIGTKTVGDQINVSADITDNVEVKEANLFYKMINDTDWKQVKMRNTTGDTYQAVIAGYDVKEGTLLYYISATDGKNTSYAGTKDVPNVVSVIGVVDVESVSLDKAEIELTIGESSKLEATVLPENATDKSVTWESSDDDIITVDDEGNIATVGVGDATITVSSKDGTKAAICNVTVKPILVTSLTIDPEEKEVPVGDTFTINATVLPDEATDKTVNYESTNTKVATVDENGKVIAIGVGEADIYVSTNDASDLSKVCKVTVNPIRVKTVSLDESSKTIDIGDEFTLTASVYPENATNKNVTWKSSEPTVAKVVDGKVTALKGGKATITAETEDGGFKAICNVTVNSILTTDIELNKDQMTINAGDSEKLTVTVSPDNATSDTFDWVSDNKSIATVKDGTVKGIKAGKTFITCTTTDGTDITKVCEVEVYEKLDKPTKPVVISKSLTSVTLKPVEGALYSKDGISWVENSEFTGLTENTEYSFYIKLKAYGYYLESDSSDATVVKTDESTISISGIELNKSDLEMMVDDNEKLTATIMPETASVQELKWTSTNPSVATVDEEGNVKAKAIGRTYITCKTTDGTEKSDICVVKVYDQYDVRDKIETEEITENSIKLKEVSGCEYKIGNGIWTTNTEFAGLEVDTEYEFSMRMAASGYHKASDVVTSKIKTSNHKLTAHEAVAASCTESGNSAYWSCDNCNKYFSDEKGETEIKKDSWIVAATGHVFDKNVAKDEYLKSAADCTHAAIYYKSCKCGEKGTETFVSGNPLNHDYKVVAGTAKEATCTEDGKEADQKCSRCEDVKVGATIKAKGHIEEIIPAVAATCTEKGKTAGKKCSVCNDILEAQKEIPAFGHKWDSGVITKAATATETGIKTYTCSVCKETKTETIPATGEQPAKPTEPPATDQGAKEDGVGTISADGKTLTDEDGTKYLVVEKVTTDQLNKNVSIADKKSGKYKITKVTKKKGKVTGGTVTYTKPYNKNCKTATVKDTVKIAGVKFNVTVIANNAFKDCEKLTKVTIGKKVTQIGKNAFNGCESLKTIIIKATNLKKVGANAFKDINSKAKFKLYKKKYSKYKKMIKRAKAPATAKYSK